ncbi:MAG TPA: hypothetical protein VJ965_00190, partial [Anaerolineales bacterium]|nr:hypothetical protein [Anaerolineales bacterium]
MSNLKNDESEKQSFWTTLPGIITAISGLVIAITGLVTVLGDYGLIELFTGKSGGPTPTAFPTATSVDTDIILPTLIQVTQQPTDAIIQAPTCKNFTEYTGKINPNAIVLAYTDTKLWIRYGDIENDVENQEDITITLFDTSDSGGNCLRQWVKYLADDHQAFWPLASTGKGRAYNEVWMNSPTPPIVGDLANWSVLPDLLLITTVDGSSNPNFAQVYMCGEDV